jgi:hypothetical protein
LVAGVALVAEVAEAKKGVACLALLVASLSYSFVPKSATSNLRLATSFDFATFSDSSQLANIYLSANKTHEKPRLNLAFRQN